MRLALTAAALVVAAGPGWAQDVPAAVQNSIEALVAGTWTDKYCPKYRANIALISDYLVQAGIKAEDFTGRYRDIMQKNVDVVREHKGMTEERFCDFLFDTYQAVSGKTHVIEKR